MPARNSAAELRRKWLGPDGREELVDGRIAVVPEHEPEAARVAQANDLPVLQHEVEVVVQPDRRVVVDQP
jgi:hypothetical protein